MVPQKAYRAEAAAVGHRQSPVDAEHVFGVEVGLLLVEGGETGVQVGHHRPELVLLDGAVPVSVVPVEELSHPPVLKLQPAGEEGADLPFV